MSGPPWWVPVVERMRDHQSEYPDNLPGAVFAAETVDDGPQIASVGDGWGTDAICNIGSMTKTFTATALLMALEERGMLDVELRVSELPGMEIYAEDPQKIRIRVRDLLQHTSGMPVFLKYTEAPAAPCNDPSGPPPACEPGAPDLGPTATWIGSPGYTNELVLAGGRCRPARAAMLDDVSAYLMRHYPLVHEPGEQYSYSTANYVVAGRLIEHLTGRSPNLYLKEKLFGPLGMHDSFFVPQPTGDPAVDAWIDEGVDDDQRRRVADTTLITRDGTWPEEVAPGPDGSWDRLRRGWRFVYPDGGMFATAADLLAFLRMLRDGGMHDGRRVVSPEVMRLVLEDDGLGHTMALGHRVSATSYGQGPGTLEHMGNTMTYFWLDPRGDDPLLGVFLSQRLANAMANNNMFDGMKVIFRLFVPRVSRAVAERRAVETV
jgi:CubicO group peptidase (beta-lactamase class C family)